MKVKILRAGRDTYWYADKIGAEYEVLPDMIDNKQYALVKDKSYYIQQGDCQLVAWGIDTAFDEPDSKPWTEAAMERLTYKYPETKPINVKKTIEQLAIDVLFNTTGKTYTEREIEAVVSVVDMLKKLENV